MITTTDAIEVPEGRKIRVGFTLGPAAQVIDFAGPWEVFHDVTIDSTSAFELYTVGASKDVVKATGGMLVLPNYSVKDAPEPDMIIVPWHQSVPEITEWIQRVSMHTAITASVCTGATHLAEAGLLDGLEATSFKGAIANLEEKYPKVTWKRGMRYVDQGHVVTSGGLSAGIDMSLHIVARYFGVETAQRTADIMEYESDGWRHSKASKTLPEETASL